MHKEESHLDLGTISIHNNVIASVASIAAMEIEGVKSIGKDTKCIILEFIGRKSYAIRVQIDKTGKVTVRIPLVAKYGFNIPEIANKVQENVRNALEKATDLSIKDIDVTVQGIEKA